MDLETKKILMNDCSAMDLDSVGSVLTSENMVSPMNEDGTFDTDSGTHLYDCTDEWFNSLSSEDLTDFFEFVESNSDVVTIVYNAWKDGIWGDWETVNNCYMNMDVI